VVFEAHPELATLKREMLAAGAEAAVMSGSGSTIVGVAPSAAAAATIANALASSNPAVRLHPVGLFRAGEHRRSAAGGGRRCG
jgi:4-diphosphocytidyl-2C-methyl-D-erythritol kinase